jgi:mRNA interferase RelE/StbE
MSFELQFLPSALKEWNKLGGTVRVQLKKKLAERLDIPRVPGDALHGLADHYKIKLRSSGYRLVYRVDDEIVAVTVIVVGKRERSAVYKAAAKRAKNASKDVP